MSRGLREEGLLATGFWLQAWFEVKGCGCCQLYSFKKGKAAGYLPLAASLIGSIDS
jgi:hypothetical protein